MKKKYIKPIIEYEELDNECSFLTSSHTEGWAIDGGDVNPIETGGEDKDDDGWGDIIID